MSHPLYILNIVSQDHPGIVASVSAAVYDLGGNIESCSQTVLDGYFTFILVVSFSEPLEPDELSLRIKQYGILQQENYKLIVLPISGDLKKNSQNNGSDLFVITAFGKDRPGVIKNISKYLADKKINIVDFYSRCENSEFTMVGQVEIPSWLDLHQLQDDMEDLGRELEFTIKLQHNNIFVATNELRLHGN
ncbi:MAG: hypothetical protein LBQ54_09275 [Planctomycetaceae bacterium]|nr:hypothetical protein [Planctomycetaceae bacterium]